MPDTQTQQQQQDPQDQTQTQQQTNQDPTPQSGAAQNQEPKMISQEELDRIIADRLARERKKYADYDELKKKAEEYEKQLEEKRLAELSEKERLEEMLRKHESEKQQLAQTLESLQQAVRQEKIVNEFIKVASKYNIAYVDDALKLADLSSVVVDDEGVKGVEEAVKALAESKPFLLAQPQQPQPKPVGGPTQPNPNTQQKTAEQLLAEAAEKARKTGRIEDLMEYSRLKSELMKG